MAGYHWTTRSTGGAAVVLIVQGRTSIPPSNAVAFFSPVRMPEDHGNSCSTENEELRSSLFRQEKARLGHAVQRTICLRC